MAVADHWYTEEHRPDGSVCVYTLTRRPDEAWPDFLRGLCASFGITLVHLHNLSACRDGIIAALEGAGVRWGYTVHDVNFACPTITFLDPAGRYCGAVTDAATCARCLAAQPEFAGIDIVQWRARHGKFVDKAAFVIAPSQWAADAFARYFGRQPAVVPHGVAPLARTGNNAASVAVLLPDDNQPTVAVLGAVGPDKGARQLERLVDIARARNSPLRFVLIGYLDREHGPWQSPDARFTVHGRYAPQDLPGLLRHYRVRLVLYPSAGPETFCYTLSETWAAGLPAMVPPVGALQERVAAQQAGFVLSADEWGNDAALFDRLERLLVRVPVAGETSELAAATARSAAATRPSLEGMVAATLAIYRAVPVAAPRIRPPCRGPRNACVMRWDTCRGRRLCRPPMSSPRAARCAPGLRAPPSACAGRRSGAACTTCFPRAGRKRWLAFALTSDAAEQPWLTPPIATGWRARRSIAAPGARSTHWSATGVRRACRRPQAARISASAKPIGSSGVRARR